MSKLISIGPKKLLNFINDLDEKREFKILIANDETMQLEVLTHKFQIT